MMRCRLPSGSRRCEMEKYIGVVAISLGVFILIKTDLGSLGTGVLAFGLCLYNM